jgi:hypothetical protein
MPDVQAESFDVYDYIPELGGFRLQSAPSSGIRSLRDISNGRFSTGGRAIIDNSTRKFVGNLSGKNATHLSVGTEGTIMLHNAVSPSDLRRTMGTSGIPSALVTGDLSSLGTPETQPQNRFITLAPRNTLLYVDDTKPPGKGRYTRIDAGVFGTISPPLSNEFGRLATPEQLMVRGVAGWLSRNAPAALDRLKLGGYTLPDGTTTTVGSEIVKAIAANIAVTPLVTYILGESQ